MSSRLDELALASAESQLSRRQLLGAVLGVATAVALGGLAHPAAAAGRRRSDACADCWAQANAGLAAVEHAVAAAPQFTPIGGITLWALHAQEAIVWFAETELCEANECADPPPPAPAPTPAPAPPGQEPEYPDPCGTCSAFCSSCPTVVYGKVCCALPPVGGRSPCCPAAMVDLAPTRMT